jgi:hypothetical protein
MSWALGTFLTWVILNEVKDPRILLVVAKMNATGQVFCYPDGWWPASIPQYWDPSLRSG